jgi:hypothetical protein
MLRIVAIGALLLLAGSSPGNVDAARSASIRLSQNTRSSSGAIDYISAKGSGFAPGSTIDLTYWLDGSPTTLPGRHVDLKGNWDSILDYGCPTGAQAVYVEATYTAGGSGSVSSKTVTPAC